MQYGRDGNAIWPGLFPRESELPLLLPPALMHDPRALPQSDVRRRPMPSAAAWASVLA